MNIKTFFIIFSCCLMGTNVSAQRDLQYSQLWGEKGENWDTTKIPDFTNAGYKQGKKPIPVYTSQIDVTKLGAIGDGKTDNTQAFRDAIKQCKKNQARKNGFSNS